MNASTHEGREPDILVSVVIPLYNAESWIRLTLLSALEQTYHDIEVIVVDDGSTDGSADIVAGMAREDDRVRLIRQANGGVGKARNTGIHASKGQLIAPLDADDLWKPKKIEKQVRRFLTSRNEGMPAGLVYCWSHSIDTDGRVLRPGSRQELPEGWVADHLICENFIGNGSAPLIRKEILESVGGYDEAQCGGGCEDWHLYLKVALTAPFAGVPEYLVGYRQLPDSMSKNVDRMLVAHRLITEEARENRNRTIPESRIRDSLTSLKLWMLIDTPKFSKDFLKLLGKLFRHDPLFLGRKITLTQVRNLLQSVVRRIGIKLRGQEYRKPFLDST